MRQCQYIGWIENHMNVSMYALNIAKTIGNMIFTTLCPPLGKTAHCAILHPRLIWLANLRLVQTNGHMNNHESIIIRHSYLPQHWTCWSEFIKILPVDYSRMRLLSMPFCPVSLFHPAPTNCHFAPSFHVSFIPRDYVCMKSSVSAICIVIVSIKGCESVEKKQSLYSTTFSGSAT